MRSPQLLWLAISILLLAGACGKDYSDRPEVPPLTSTVEVKPVVEKATAVVAPLPTSTPTQIPVLKVKNPYTEGGFQAGVDVVIYGNDPSFDEKTEALFDRLVGLNVNSVALVFPFYQEGWYSSNVTTFEETPTDANILSFIRRAHARGFLVVVRPLIDERGIMKVPPYWRGNIEPQDVTQWFATYGQLLVKYATLAQSENAEVFSLGVELTSMTKPEYAQYWSLICEQVKSVYKGKLAYAMNHGAENNLPCYDSLDHIGIDAFYEHAAPNGTEDEIMASWQRYTPYFEGLKQRGKPIIFSEVGLRSQVGAFQTPWVWSSTEPVSLENQRAFVSATCRALKGTISGFYFWSVGLDPVPNPASDTSFEFLGKPAEEALRNCYAQ